MIKRIKLYWLRFRLAGLFKKAQMYVDLGKEPGDVVFVCLYKEAISLCDSYNAIYKDFDKDSIPSLVDLSGLAACKPKSSPIVKISLFAGIAIVAGVAVGAYAGLIAIGFHCVVKILGR